MSVAMPVLACDAIGRLRADVDELAGLDPATLSDVTLADDLLALRREIDRLEGAFARLARAGHLRGVGAVDGAASTAAWLRHRAGMREGDAKAAIQAGEVCDLLPATGAAWRAGEITAGAARTIVGTRVEGHDEELVACEPVLLDLARERDLRRLGRACGHFRNLARADGTAPCERDGLHLSRSYDGRSVLSGDFGDAAAETITTALHAFCDPPSDEDRRTTSQRYAAALVRICEVALAAGPGGRRARYHASMVVDWPTLTAGRVGRMDGEFTGPIHRQDVARILCDCSISRVVTGPDGLPLDVGRSRRTIPPSLRRALVARDGGCRFPGCNRPPGWCDAHHVRPWPDGGPTCLENLLLECDHHHHVVHQPGWRVTFDGREAHFYRPDGTEVLP